MALLISINQTWRILFTINHLFTVKCFQVLLFNTIKNQSFIYTQLDNQFYFKQHDLP